MSLPQLVKHSVTSEWPSSVKPLADLLQLPLPTYLFTEPCPHISPPASYLLEELQNNSPFPAARDDICISTPSPLLDVLETVLLTVLEIRNLTHQQCNGNHRSTVPVWAALLRTLGTLVSETACVL